MWLCHSSICGFVVLHFVALSFFIMWLCHSSSCGFVVLHYVALSFFIMWVCCSSFCGSVILHHVAMSFFIMWICCYSFVEQTLSGFYHCLQQHSVLGDIFVSIVSKQQRYVYCVVAFSETQLYNFSQFYLLLSAVESTVVSYLILSCRVDLME